MQNVEGKKVGPDKTKNKLQSEEEITTKKEFWE